MSILFPANTSAPVLALTLPPTTPAIDILVKNVTTGKSLTLNLPSEYDGADLELDFGALTVTDEDGVDQQSLLSAVDRSLWTATPLINGANDIRIEAKGGTVSVTKSPTEVESDGSEGGDRAWTNPGNAKASDNTYATVKLEPGGGEKGVVEESENLYAKKYGFAVPAGSEILGVQLDLECVADFEAISDSSISLVASTPILSDRPEIEPGGFWAQVESIRRYGGLGDLWLPVFSGPIEPADVNHASFGPRLRLLQMASAVANCSVDHMPLTVYFREAATSYEATATLRAQRGYY
jgi:hypothetical protein